MQWKVERLALKTLGPRKVEQLALKTLDPRKVERLALKTLSSYSTRWANLRQASLSPAAKVSAKARWRWERSVAKTRSPSVIWPRN